MDKNRPLPPDIFTDVDLISLPAEVKVTAFGLHFHADDEGRQTLTTWQIKGKIWPGNPEITEDTIIEHILMLEEAGYLITYYVGDRAYFQLTRWPRPNHPLKSAFPPPPADRRRTASDARAGRSAWEGEGEGEPREARERPRERPAGDPPSPFCRAHQPAGSGGVPCIHCQDARLAYQVWERQQRALAREEEEL